MSTVRVAHSAARRERGLQAFRDKLHCPTCGAMLQQITVGILGQVVECCPRNCTPPIELCPLNRRRPKGIPERGLDI